MKGVGARVPNPLGSAFVETRECTGWNRQAGFGGLARAGANASESGQHPKGALGVVILRNPFYSVLALVVHLISLAALFLLLRAEFEDATDHEAL